MQVFIYYNIPLHVSGVHRTHHQENIKLTVASGTGHNIWATDGLDSKPPTPAPQWKQKIRPYVTTHNNVLGFFSVILFCAETLRFGVILFFIFLQLLEPHAFQLGDLFELSNSSDAPIYWRAPLMYFCSQRDPANLRKLEARTREEGGMAELENRKRFRTFKFS